MKYAVMIMVCLYTFSANAEDSPKTVTLTANELQSIVNAEVSKAIAREAYAKVQEAFAAKPPSEDKK